MPASPWKFGRSKPVIGITGGIGSGKSTVSRLFGKEGCAVIDSDALTHEVLEWPEVREELRTWLGESAFTTDGRVDRRSVGRQVFADSEKIARLNSLVHPRVARRRAELMDEYLADVEIPAIVWDSPLLVEAGLHEECDALVFVKVPAEVRRERVYRKRGWSSEEFDKREKLQFPLDKKAEFADYCIDNSGDEASSLSQVQRVLSHLLASKA